MRLSITVATASALVAAGCGGGPSASHTTSSAKTFQRCNPGAALSPRQKRQARAIGLILARMRAAKGHARASALTDRFLLAVGRSSLPVYTKNRLIDHAVAAVTALCEDCFQALEAARPIAGSFRCG